MAAANPLFESGRTAEAIDTVFRYLGGPDYREQCDRHLPPGWFEGVLADWEQGLQHDFIAMNAWRFGPEHAARITAPVLNMKAIDTTALHHAFYEAIRSGHG